MSDCIDDRAQGASVLRLVASNAYFEGAKEVVRQTRATRELQRRGHVQTVDVVHVLESCRSAPVHPVAVITGVGVRQDRHQRLVIAIGWERGIAVGLECCTDW